MKLDIKAPKESFGEVLRNYKPIDRHFEVFKSNLETFLGEVDEQESEEHQKYLVRDLLLKSFYQDGYQILPKGKQDFAIHLGKNNKSKVGAIIETKKPRNKSEMIAAAKPNAKALHELVLYYFDERVGANNFELKNLVITDFYHWYVFDANTFDRYFYNNAEIKRLYEVKTRESKTNPFFYDELAKILNRSEDVITCVHFDLREQTSEDQLIDVYKTLMPAFLLKAEIADDNNALNKPFYNELLHIIGLEEIRDNGGKGKVKIVRKSRPDAGSFIEQTLQQLESKNRLSKISNLERYGADYEEQLFNVALELCLTWINRVLFLKLLEAQLVGYHGGDADYKFLNHNFIRDFDELFTLFHDVLAKREEDRQPDVRDKFWRIPYLNSSLFDLQPDSLEDQTITVDALKTTKPLDFAHNSALKDQKNQSFNALEYLFRFLDKHDFSNVEKQEALRRQDRPIINASVLGKIFEKINGYKDGSFYTPGFITMYMCRNAIRLAVVQKFNDAYPAWKIETFDGLVNKIGRYDEPTKILEFNRVINSLKICDPAVGSGHFLVSALNEIIGVKHELGILADETGRTFAGYNVSVRNDELSVTRQNQPFKYEIIEGKPDAQAERFQKALFHDKQTIIENCLFGVDINPNSVKICRLRLWIELLKNAYYKDVQSSNFSLSASEAGREHAEARTRNYTELETLPNIDINIKTGNSLISRFALKDKFRNEKINNWIKEYSHSVEDYKDVRDSAQKDEIRRRIENFRKVFAGLLEDETTNLKKQLDKKIYALQENQNPLFIERNNTEKEIATRRLKDEIAKLETQIGEINSQYQNAFEWRFEFPEVLNADGDFTGFDAIVGNPPYIRQEEFSDLKPYLKKRYEVFAGTADLLVYFYELGLSLLKPNGSFSFITSNKFMRAGYGKALRQHLAQYSLTNIVDFGDAPVFDEAIAYPMILNLKKSQVESGHQTHVYTFPNTGKVSDFETNHKTLGFNVAQNELTADGWRLERTDNFALLHKLRSKGTPLGEYVNGRFYYGIKTGLNEAFVVNRETRDKLIAEDNKSAEILKPFLRGRDVKRWQVESADLWLIATFPALKLKIEDFPAIEKHLLSFGKGKLEQSGNEGSRKKTFNKWFETQDQINNWQEYEKTKIILPAIENKCAFAIDESGFYGNDKTNICIAEEPGFVAAILNSSVSWWIIRQTASEKQNAYYEFKPMYVSQIPIPLATDEQKQTLETLVDQIIELKKQGGETTELEAEIDEIVFDLYELTADERRLIAGEA